jgi:hypothetical protein
MIGELPESFFYFREVTGTYLTVYSSITRKKLGGSVPWWQNQFKSQLILVFLGKELRHEYWSYRLQT